MTRKQIRQRVIYWQKRMGLHNWEIYVTFESVKNNPKHGRFEGIARNESWTQYKMTTLTFLPSKLKQVTDNVVLHELLHSVLSELTGYVRGNMKREVNEAWLNYYEEQATSELERIIYRIHKNTTI